MKRGRTASASGDPAPHRHATSAWLGILATVLVASLVGFNAYADTVGNVENIAYGQDPPVGLYYNPVINQAILLYDFPVNSGLVQGENTWTPLQQGRLYEFTTRGVYRNVNGQELADAECTRPKSAEITTEDRLKGAWGPNRFADVDPDPNDDLQDLYIDGAPITWRPAGIPAVAPGSVVPACNEASHTYATVFSPPTTGFVNFKIHDTFYGDNNGLVWVMVREANADLDTEFVETVEVDTSSPAGTSTTSALEDGNVYLFIAKGSWQHDNRVAGRLADAECSLAESGSKWERNQYGRTVPVDDPLDLLVDGLTIEWVSEDNGSCSPQTHQYRHYHLMNGTYNLNFAVLDFDYSDNSGTIPVDIYRIESQ